MKIFAISDIHGETRFIDAAADLIRSADVVTISGDITATGKSDEAVKVISHLEKYTKRILAVHGNWDRIEILDFLDDKGYNLHENGKIIDGIGFFGVGGSGLTPMKTVTEYSEEDLYEFLEIGYSKIKNAEHIVLISHTPPRNTRDRTFFGMRGGSVGVSNFLEEHLVHLAIVGHIHEARGVAEIGAMKIVNPGSFKKGRYSYIEINDAVTIHSGKLKK